MVGYNNSAFKGTVVCSVSLKTPTGQPINYDQVFDLALANVRSTWLQLCAALAAKDQKVFALKNADLDTGEADEDKKQIFFA